jgi:hypothetical protein
MRKGRSLFSLAIVMDIVGKYLQDSNLYDVYNGEYLRSRLTLLHGMTDFIQEDLKAEAFLMLKERYDDEARKYVSSKACKLNLRTRSFYKMLDGSIISSIIYKSIMLARKVYRAFK